MSSLQSLRELISERLAAAAEEICRLCEGTIVQYEEELCRQRRLLDIIWKPQLQLHQIVLPQHWLNEKEDFCNQQRNFRVEQEEPEPAQVKEELEEPEPAQIKEEQEEQESPQIKEQLKEPEPPQIKEEQGWLEPLQIKDEQEGFYISQDEEQLDMKQETDTLMEIPAYEENCLSEADLNNQQRFNVTDSQDEEGNQHEESTSTTDGETDPQNRDQRKRRDRNHVQSVDSSHMPAGQCYSDDRKSFKKATLVKKTKQFLKEKRLSSLKSGKRTRIAHNMSEHMITESAESPYVCEECDKRFDNESKFRIHMRIHTGEKPFSCKECDKSFNKISHLKRHIRTHTGEKPFLCKVCNKSFSDEYCLKTHMRTHTGERPFLCKECDKRFIQMSHLKKHMRTHTGEKPFFCTECDKRFSQKFNVKIHMRTHTVKKPFLDKKLQ